MSMFARPGCEVYDVEPTVENQTPNVVVNAPIHSYRRPSELEAYTWENAVNLLMTYAE